MPAKIAVEILGDSSSLERAFARSRTSAKSFNRDVESAGRGALAASLSFKGLGRALTFASAPFLAAGGTVAILKSTVEQAKESQRVLGQTALAVRRAGESWQRYGKQVQAAALQQANLSGFDDERLLGTFSQFVRRTGDVTRALELNALAADVARGRNIELEQAAQLVLKASLGQAGALRRLGIDAKKGANGLQLIDSLSKKYAGSAAAYGKSAAGAQDRFNVAIGNLQEQLGNAALPSLTRYLDKGADWLNQAENQERVQRNLDATVKAASTVVHDASEAWGTLADTLGGNKAAVRTLIGAYAGLKLLSLIKNVQGLAGAWRGVATMEALAARNSRLPFAVPGGPAGAAAGKGGIPNQDLRTVATGGGLAALLQGLKAFPLLAHPNQRPLTPEDLQRILGIKPSTGLGGSALARLLGEPGPFANLIKQAPRIGASDRGVPTSVRGSFQRFADLDFTLPFRLQLEQAQAVTDKEAVQAAKGVQAAARKAIESGRLSRQGLLNAYTALASATQTISASVAASAEQARATAEAAKELRESFAVPLRLQLAEAKASASLSEKDDRKAAARIKQAAQAALKSGRLGVQGQIDAWQTIASANDTLRRGLEKSGAQMSKFVKTSASKLTAGLDLSRDQRLALRQRLAQVSARGAVPGRQSPAFALAVGGSDEIVVNTTVNLDGQKVAANTTRHQRKAATRRTTSRRGPHAGFA